MSDELKPLADIAQQSGWFFAGLTAVWGVVLRWIVGRHIKAFDMLDAKIDNVIDRLSSIEGRFAERDTGRYRTDHGEYR